MKKILVLGTGGTIACVPTADGLVPDLDAQALLQAVSRLTKLYTITTKQLFSIDSSNLEPRHWQELVRAIAEDYDAYDGFVITHGTDTMAYTAAALSHMLRNVRKPVVLTGSQLPLQADGSDAPANILHTFLVACGDLQGVALVFGDSVIHGAHAKKLYTQGFNAFQSINAPLLASIADERLVWNDTHGGGYGTGTFACTTELEPRIGIIKLFPGASPELLRLYLRQGYRGLIIEGFGAGGVPNSDELGWMPLLEEALRRGVRIICASQCLYDGVHLDTYPMGVLAQRLGARSAERDTLESSVIKLMIELKKEQ
jgi:L-asparaginase